MSLVRFNRGFTIIELLVIIAIIGILTSVVLGSLTTARLKGQDAAIQQSVSALRSEAELIGNQPDGTINYDAVCGSGTQTIRDKINSISGTSTAICADSTSAWAYSTPLVATAGQYFCVDSSGVSSIGTTSSLTNTSDTDCP